MEKTAALNKLAGAVRDYVQAEAQFNKIAQTSQQYVMEKNAQGIMQRLGLAAKQAPLAQAPNMGRNAALAALLLGVGGGAAGAAAHQNKDAIMEALSSLFQGNKAGLSGEASPVELGPRFSEMKGGMPVGGFDLPQTSTKDKALDALYGGGEFLQNKMMSILEQLKSNTTPQAMQERSAGSPWLRHMDPTGPANPPQM